MITGNDPGMGIIANIVVGIIGALIGGWVADRLGVGGEAGPDRPTSIVSFIVAVLGAVVLLFILNILA